MPRRNLFHFHRPVLGGARGGTVPHRPFAGTLSSAIVWEIVVGVLLTLLIVFAILTIRTNLIAQDVVNAPRSITAGLRSYDAVEGLRTTRLIVGNRSYDALEGLRATRLASPIVSDRSYDRLEQIRMDRGAGN